MPLPKDRRKKRIFRRVPSGEVRMAFKEEKKHVPRCAICKVELKGTSYSRKLSPSERRPERPFGGYLCHKCAEKVMKYRTWVKTNVVKPSEVPMLYQRYL